MPNARPPAQDIKSGLCLCLPESQSSHLEKGVAEICVLSPKDRPWAHMATAWEVLRVTRPDFRGQKAGRPEGWAVPAL